MNVYTNFRSEFHKEITEFPNIQKKLLHKNRHSKIYLITLIPKSSSSLKYNIIMKSQKKKFRRQNIQYSFKIGHFIINKLNSPFFCLTYDNIADNKEDHLLLEYIKGPTLRDYLRSKKFSNDTKDFYEFLCIFLRILDSLNIFQQKYYFTHYDLHLSNIILTNSTNIRNDEDDNNCYHHLCSYALDNSIYIINDSSKSYLKPVLIDFEYSTARRYASCSAFSNTNVFPEYGYIGVFFSGVDVLRLLFCIKRETMSILNTEHSFYSRIQNLVNNILKTCYDIDFPELFTVEQLKRHSKFYYYMLHTSKIFTSPLPIMKYIVNLYENDLGLKRIQESHSVRRVEYNMDDVVKFLNLKREIQSDTIYIPSVFSSRETHLLFLRKYRTECKELFKKRYSIFQSKDVLFYHKFMELLRATESISQFVSKDLDLRKNELVNDIYCLTGSPLNT